MNFLNFTKKTEIRFFFFNARQQAQLEKGNWIRCFGEVRVAQGELEIIHPETEVIEIDDPPPLSTTLTPIYPTTEGVHQISIKKILQQVIGSLKTQCSCRTCFEKLLKQRRTLAFALWVSQLTYQICSPYQSGKIFGPLVIGITRNWKPCSFNIGSNAIGIDKKMASKTFSDVNLPTINMVGG